MARKVLDRKQQESQQKGSHWNPEQSKRLLSYILNFKRKIFDKLTNETLEQIYHYIGKTRTIKQCSDKLNNLKKSCKTYEKIVTQLQKKSGVDSEWRKQRQDPTDYRKATEFQTLFQGIRSKLTMTEEAWIRFITSFDPQKVEYQKRKIIKKNQTSYLSYLQSLLQKSKNLQNRYLKIIDLSSSLNIDNEMDRTADTISGANEFLNQSEEYESEHNIRIQEEAKNISKRPLNTKYGWNSTELLRYIIFLEKYACQFMTKKQSFSTNIYNKMARFVGSKNSQNCNQFHQEQFRKVSDFSKLISKIKETLQVTEKQVLWETERMDQFYKKDLEFQLNAFKTKKSCLIEQSTIEIFQIAKNIQQWIVENQLKNKSENQKQLMEKHKGNQKIARIQEEQQEQKSYFIEIPIQLYIFFKKEEETKKYTTTQKQKNKSLRQNEFPIKPQKLVSCENKSNFSIEKNIEQIIQEEQFSEKIYQDDNSLDDFKDTNMNEREGKKSVQNDEKLVEQQRRQVIQNKKKKRKKVIWTISQNMKFLAYVTTNYRTFLIENINYKLNILTKMREYIGIQKTHKDCAEHLDGLKKRYGYNLCEAIEEDGKKINITPKFIDEYKNFISDHTEFISINIAQDTLLKFSIIPTKVQIQQKEKEKIQIYMEKILENGMEITVQISTSYLTQNIVNKITIEKQTTDSLFNYRSQQLFFKHHRAIKRKTILSLPENIMKILEQKKNSQELLIIQFNQLIEINLKMTGAFPQQLNNLKKYIQQNICFGLLKQIFLKILWNFFFKSVTHIRTNIPTEFVHSQSRQISLNE